MKQNRMMVDGEETRLEQKFDSYQRLLVEWNTAIGEVHKADNRHDNNQNRMLQSVAHAKLSIAHNAYKKGQSELQEAVLASRKQKPNWSLTGGGH